MIAERPAPVTIKEIAAKAGYSHAAVSSVLNGRAMERRISSATVRKVEEAARDLGYVANIAARRLRSHETGTSQAILAVITSVETPLLLVSRAACALQRCIEEKGRGRTRFSVTIEMFHAGRLHELPGILGNDRFSGAIIANTIEADDQFLASARIPFPVVLIGRVVAGFPSVLESAETGSAAAGVLIASRCRQCAYLAPALVTSISRARSKDFAQALAVAGLAEPLQVECADRSERAGYEAMRTHLNSGLRADGFFAVNDSLAIGAFHAAREAGLRIPEDLCFVGVGDSDAAPFLSPPLTCVGSSEDVLHAEAARLLLRSFTGREAAPVPVRLPLTHSAGSSARLGWGSQPAASAR